MTVRAALQVLRLYGWSDNKIATHIGQILGTTGPSERSVHRWRTGSTNPIPVYKDVIDSLYKDTAGEKNEGR